MPKVAYADAALTVWKGRDVPQFIDGLSTNKTIDMVKGEIRQTDFTSSKAKITGMVVYTWTWAHLPTSRSFVCVF